MSRACRCTVVAALVTLLCVAAAGRKLSWGVPCSVPNDCARDKHNLFCRAVGVNGTSFCVQCDGDDACDPHEFCVRASTRVDDAPVAVGQCASRRAPLGSRCDASITAATVRFGVNEQLYCGLVTEWDSDGKPSAAALQPQWEGACVDKSCVECLVGTVAGKRRCYSTEVSGRGGFWALYRAGEADQSIMGINQNSLAQILLVIAAFNGAVVALVGWMACRPHALISARKSE